VGRRRIRVRIKKSNKNSIQNGGLYYLGMSLFGLGAIGIVLNRENLSLVLMSLELE